MKPPFESVHYIERAKNLFLSLAKSGWLMHAARTGLAAVTSLMVARLCRMPEAYWAPMTTLIVMQSTLGAAWTVSKQRLIGTALGAAVGALLASLFGAGIILFGVAIFVLGLVCAIVHLDQSAYRFAGITLTIVMLVAGPRAPWITGMHRFVEVSLGIGVGLLFSALPPRSGLPRAKSSGS